MPDRSPQTFHPHEASTPSTEAPFRGIRLPDRRLPSRYRHLLPLSAAASFFLLLFASVLAPQLTAQIPGGAIAYYPFNGNANDQSGNGHHGTLRGPTSIRDRFGQAASAYSFDGNDDIVIPTHVDFDELTWGRGPSSISFWLRVCEPTYTQSRIVIVRLRDDAGATFEIYLNNSGAGIGVRAGLPSSSVSINDGQWHHVAVTVSDTTRPGGILTSKITIYVDGVQSGSANTGIGGNTASTKDVVIGANPSGIGYFLGALDDIRMYDRELSSTEVDQLYKERGWPVPDLVLTLMGPSTICPGDTVRVRVNAQYYDRIAWNVPFIRNEGDVAVLLPDRSGTVTATATLDLSAPPCAAMQTTDESFSITVRDGPKANPGAAQYICPGSTITLGRPTTGGAPPYQFAWRSSEGGTFPTTEQITVTPTKTQTYTLRVTDANGCSNEKEVSITVENIPGIDLGPDTLRICMGDSVRLGALATGNAAVFTYRWAPATGLNRIDSAFVMARPTVPTTYVVSVVEGTAGNCPGKDSVVVIPQPLPTVSAGADVAVCAGASETLGAPAVPGITYAWRPAAGLNDAALAQPTVTPTATTQYIVRATDAASNCSTEDTVIVTVRSVILQVDRSSLSFGTLGACSSENTLTISVRNTGTTPADLSGTFTTGTAFSLPDGVTISLNAGEEKQIRVRFSPSAAGSHSDELVLTSNPCGVETRVQLTGDKELGSLSVTPGSVDFGRQAFCRMTDQERTIDIVNGGAEAAKVTLETPGAGFTVVTPTPWPDVAAGGRLTLTVRWTPTAVGVDQQELRLPYTIGACTDTLRVSLRGEVEESGVTVEYNGIDFAQLSGCETARDTTITVTNTSSAEQDITLAVTGDYQIIGPTTVTVPGGGSVQVTLRFAPAAAGPATGELLVTGSDCGDEHRIVLTGEKAGVTFSVTGAVDFGERGICAGESYRLPIDISFGGTGDGSITSAQIVGGGGAFTTTVVGGEMLPSGVPQQYEAIFTPTTDGTVTAELVLVLEPCNVERRILLTGIGRAVNVELLDVAYGQVPVRGVRQAVARYINQGTSTTQVGGVAVTGGPFRLVSTTPQVPTPVAPGETLEIALEYTAALGTSAGEVQVELESPCDMTVTAVLTGEGVGGGRARVRVPAVIAGSVGEVVEMPLEIVESEGLEAAGVDRVRAWLVIEDASVAVTQTGVSRKEQKSRVIELEGALPNGGTGVIDEVALRVLLGRVERSAIRLDSVRWFDGAGARVDVETVLESGELQVEELCREGGVRLYDPEGGVVLRLVGSQPLTTGEAVLEHVLRGAGRALVMDVMGRERVNVELASGSGATVLDRGELESGVYWLMVETDGQVFTMPFRIVR